MDHQRRQAAMVLERHGMTVRLDADWRSAGCIWDGEALNADRLDAETMYHEFGHFLVAPEESRGLREYGLGTAPFAVSDIRAAGAKTTWQQRKQLTDKDGRTIEEDLAYLLGLWHTARSGLDIEAIVKEHPVLVDSDALLGTPSLFWPLIERLVDMKLIEAAL
jgi:hypothetical protein